MEIKKAVNEFLKRTKLYKRKGTYDYYVKISKALFKAFKYLGYEDTNDLTFGSRDEIVLYYKNHASKKNNQINADVSFLYTVLSYNQIQHKMPHFVKLPDDTTPFRPLRDELLIKFLRYLKELDLTISNNLSWVLAMYLMLETGVRMNELLHLKTKNIDLVSNTILLDTTKNGKKRIVFFDMLSRDTLIKAMKYKKEFIIWNYNKDEPMNRVAIFYFMNKVFRDLGEESKITAHRLRKTFATRLLKAGCPLTTIQKLLGHLDIKMTMKYLEIDLSMIEKDYFKYYPYKSIIENK